MVKDKSKRNKCFTLVLIKKPGQCKDDTCVAEFKLMIDDCS